MAEPDWRGHRVDLTAVPGARHAVQRRVQRAVQQLL
jgi:hypothetical protein